MQIPILIAFRCMLVHRMRRDDRMMMRGIEVVGYLAGASERGTFRCCSTRGRSGFTQP